MTQVPLCWLASGVPGAAGRHAICGVWKAFWSDVRTLLTLESSLTAQVPDTKSHVEDPTGNNHSLPSALPDNREGQDREQRRDSQQTCFAMSCMWIFFSLPMVHHPLWISLKFGLPAFALKLEFFTINSVKSANSLIYSIYIYCTTTMCHSSCWHLRTRR